MLVVCSTLFFFFFLYVLYAGEMRTLSLHCVLWKSTLLPDVLVHFEGNDILLDQREAVAIS
ncbi:Uncharacterized protein APZ42_005533 [Daphnia magna]|uniref:Uncharacterized protein n=1 Tax=Daphnia magna TaxID=35525 RepID=A0A164GEB4_9CRUS|nr:Uncharacterized protein APZ42_005533 [Daphnia magna]